jgi:hypothetical protein
VILSSNSSQGVFEYISMACISKRPLQDYRQYFEGENTSVNILSIDAILRKPSFEALVKIVVVKRTVQRRFRKLGYIYGRNKKGFCDGNERPDVGC